MIPKYEIHYFFKKDVDLAQISLGSLRIDLFLSLISNFAFATE